MKKLLLGVLFGVCVANAGSLATLRWQADVSRPTPAAFAVLRGDSVSLECTLVDRGAPLNVPTNTVATMYWQTNGMSSVWWSAPASISGSVVRARWTPAMDTGSDSVTFFIGAEAPGARLYRAFGRLAIGASPGAQPNELPLPQRVFDCSRVEVLGTLDMRDGWVRVMAGPNLGASYMYDSIQRVSEDNPQGVVYYLRGDIPDVPVSGIYNIAVVEEIPAIVARELRFFQNTIWDEELGVTWLRVMRGGNVYYEPVANTDVTTY